MHYRLFPRRRDRGFSLVEIMVGIAIGMIGVLVIMQVAAVFEGQKRTTTTGADAQTNGVTALYTVERDVRRAGYGLNATSALGCKINRYFDTGPTSSLILSPVIIVDGAAGAPDSIEVLASSKGGWSVPNRVTVDHPASAANIFMNTTLGVNVGDLLVVSQPGLDCTLIQATGIPNGNVQVLHQNTSKWNPPGGQNIFPPSGYSIGAQVLNLGTLIDHTYSLSNGNLVLSDVDSTTNTAVQRPVIGDIVQLQAQYGFDTRAGPQTDPRVDTWSATMIDADGNGTVYPTATPGQGDIARIVAVRMVIVARSPLMEKPNASGVCDTTTTQPSWAGGTITINTDPNWKCYRYKTLETVIPLRNILWGNT